MTGLKSYPCVLVTAEALALLRAKAADATPNAFGFQTAAIWVELRTRADRLATAPTYSYTVNCPGANRVTLDTFEYTLSDQTPPKHDKSPNYPPWTAMFREREDGITTRLVAFSFAYLVAGDTKYFEKNMAGWAPRANEDLPNHRIETEGVAEGKQCASIEKSGYSYADRFGLPAGTTVTATARVRTTPLGEGQGATMTLYFWRGGKAFGNQRVGPFADTVWTEHTLTAKVHAGTEEVSLALEFFAPGKRSFDHVRLTTDLPVAKTVEPQVRALADEVHDLTTGQDRFLVSFGEAGKMREVAGIRSDGEAAVVAFAGGKVMRGFVVGGTVLEYQGRRVIAQDKAGTAEADLEGTATARTDEARHDGGPLRSRPPEKAGTRPDCLALAGGCGDALRWGS